jgi:hypothetical protein
MSVFKVRFALKFIYITTLLIVFQTFTFPVSSEFRKLKEAYDNQEFSVVISIFDKMSNQSSEFVKNRKNLYLMAARAYADIATLKSDWKFYRIKIKELFLRLFDLDHSFRKSNLLTPTRNRNRYFMLFQAVREKLFGMLTINTNKPGVEIYLNGEFQTITDKGSKVNTYSIWVGTGEKKRITLRLEYEDPNFKCKYPRNFTIAAGEERKIDAKYKSIDAKRKPRFIELIVIPNVLKFSEKLFKEKVNYVQPYKDFFEFGVRFQPSRDWALSFHYGLSLNVLEKKNKWNGEKHNSDYVDYNTTNLSIQWNYKIFAFGYRGITLEKIDENDNQLKSKFDLLFFGVERRFRSNQRNDIMSSIGLFVLLGIPRIQNWDASGVYKLSDILTYGLLVSSEFGYSFNRIFNLSLGVSYEIIANFPKGETENTALDHFFKPVDLLHRFKIYSRFTLRL